MNWKTCSVEARGGISKRGTNPARSEADSDRPVSGMQKHGLTMFARTCYSGLVPRVHPSLVCTVGFAAAWAENLQ
jgi:hypothetical protein